MALGAQAWNAQQAMREMHYFGYKGIHHLMCPGLAEYEKEFPERFKTTRLFWKADENALEDCTHKLVLIFVVAVVTISLAFEEVVEVAIRAAIHAIPCHELLSIA